MNEEEMAIVVVAIVLYGDRRIITWRETEGNEVD